MTQDSLIHPKRGGVRHQKGLTIAREGYPFIAGSALAALILAILGFYVFVLLFLVLTAFVTFFFRDPERMIPETDAAAVSPADGKVLSVGLVDRNEFCAEKMLKISIFMSVFNVHVNRVPENSLVSEVAYRPGKFFSANLDKASEDNERNAVTLETADGRKLIVVQVAGLIARRIVCRIRKGDRLSRGQRFGIICFGSRLDVYLPADTTPAVSVGDKVLAGTSVLGHLS